MNFDELNLAPAILRAVQEQGYTAPTPIQAQAIPVVLGGHDLLAGAQTGTGKTAGFTLPMLQLLSTRPAAKAGAIRALVLTPTRELAAQVEEAIRAYGKYLELTSTVIFGGVGMNPQINRIARGVDILVATPGRLLDLEGQNHIDLSHVEILVLDEADRMLDMGFEEPVREIAGRCDRHRQTLLFSATFPDPIRELARQLLREPVEVAHEGAESAPAIEQRFFDVEPAYRQKAVAGLLLRYRPESAVVFCNTRKDVDEVAGSLRQFGFSALALHGDMEQRDRDEVLLQLANRSCNVLVASDVAARGIDVEDLAAVVNYELPTDVDAYRHRIGRTGRAGRKGLALSLVAPRENARAEMVAAAQDAPPPREASPLATGRPAQPVQAPMTTLRIDGGKTDKLRAGDILGALTGEAGLPAKAIGKIAIHATRSYVAIAREQAPRALKQLEAGKIKGRRFRVRPL